MGSCTSAPAHPGAGVPSRKRPRKGKHRRYESIDREGVLPNKHRVALLMGMTDAAGAESAVKRSLRDSPLWDARVLEEAFALAAPAYEWKVDEVNKRLNRYGWTELMVAAKEGRAEETRALINAGADLDLRTSGGSTALMNGAFYGHEAVVRQLVGAGARMDLKCNNGFTALRWAQDQKHEGCAKLLRDAPRRAKK